MAVSDFLFFRESCIKILFDDIMDFLGSLSFYDSSTASKKKFICHRSDSLQIAMKVSGRGKGKPKKKCTQ